MYMETQKKKKKRTKKKAVSMEDSIDYPLLCVRDVHLTDHSFPASDLSSLLTSKSDTVQVSVSSLCDEDSARQMSEAGLPTSFSTTNSHGGENGKKRRAKARLRTAFALCSDDASDELKVESFIAPVASADGRSYMVDGLINIQECVRVCNGINGEEIPTYEGSMVSIGRHGEATALHDVELETDSSLLLDGLLKVCEGDKVLNGVTAEEVITDEGSMASVARFDEASVSLNVVLGSHSTVIRLDPDEKSEKSDLEPIIEDVDEEGPITGEEMITGEGTMVSITRVGGDTVLPNATIGPYSTIRDVDTIEDPSPDTFGEGMAILHHADREPSSCIPVDGLLRIQEGAKVLSTIISEERTTGEDSIVSLARDGKATVSHNLTVESNSTIVFLDGVELSESPAPKDVGEIVAEATFLHNVDIELDSTVTHMDANQPSDKQGCAAIGEALIGTIVSNNVEMISNSNVRLTAVESLGSYNHEPDNLALSQTEIAIATQGANERSIITNSSWKGEGSLVSNLGVVPEVHINPLQEVAADKEVNLTHDMTCEEPIILPYEASAEREVSPLFPWIPYWDGYYSRYYFYNSETLETTWEPPEGFGNYSFEMTTEDSSVSQVTSECCDQNNDKEIVVSNIIDEMIESVIASKNITETKLKKMSRRQKKTYESQMRSQNEYKVDMGEHNKESMVSNIINEMIESVVIKNMGDTEHKKMSRRQKQAYALQMRLEENQCSDTKHKKMSRRQKQAYALQMILEENQCRVYMGEDSPTVLKYWVQRYRLFSKFDAGVKLDEEGWFSVTPEAIAKYQAARCNKGVIVDAFTGVGGNAIQFALAGHHVIAIDNDPRRIEYAQHNATVYGVSNRIDFILGDFFTVSSSLRSDIIFLSPPWGGPEYLNVKVYDIETMLQPRAATSLFKVARAVAPNVILFLPRNVALKQLAELSRTSTPPCVCEVERFFLSGKLKAVTAYYGQFVGVEPELALGESSTVS